MSSHYKQITPAEIKWQGNWPCSALFDDIYFSRKNGVDESRHVFIDSQSLIERWSALKPGETFTIAETGFGTGLNFLLCCHLWLQHAPEHCRLHYISFEKYPLKKEDLCRALSLWPELSTVAEQLIQNYPPLVPGFHCLEFFDGTISLNLMYADVLEAYKKLSLTAEPGLEQRLRCQQVDAWFLDGFAPAKNESMWKNEPFFLMASLSGDRATVASFSASRQLKTGLESAGFVVEKKKGYRWKRHMITAVFHTAEAKTLHSLRTTPWFVSDYSSVKEKSALVVGAGLAGCFIAWRLAAAGWKVSVVDKLSSAGQQASGNPGAVLFPKLSAYQSPLSELMLSAYLYSSRFIRSIYSEVKSSGCLILSDTEKELKVQKEIERWLSYCPDLAVAMDEQQASEKAGIPLHCGGLFFPESFYLDSKAFCEFLLSHPNIEFFPETSIQQPEFINGQWVAGGHQASILILANGWEAKQVSACDGIPFRALSGQMTALKPSPLLAGLNTVLCGSGHLLPADGEMQWTGTSYHPNDADNTIRPSDDADNIAKLGAFVKNLEADKMKAIASWAGVRCSTTDYMPVIGELCHNEQFYQQYSKFKKNANAWYDKASPSMQGLYVFSGFGSKGLTTIPLLSLHLLNLIEGRFSPLPSNLIQAVSPSRFLYRALCRSPSRL